jgi:hypothetical protein
VSYDAAFPIERSFLLSGDFSGSTPLIQPDFPLIDASPHDRFALTRPFLFLIFTGMCRQRDETTS